MPSAIDKIELEVQKALTNIANEWEDLPDPNSDAAWTRAIKDAIGSIGEKNGCQVYAAGSRFSESGEWLFDMTWREMSGDLIISLPLVLECEWTPSGTLKDFQKLLIARAERRVMIFWDSNERAARATIQALINQVTKFQMSQRGDRYLFACYLGDQDIFLFEPYGF